MTAAPTTLGSMVWYARHEARLAWRDWISMMTAGRPGRLRIILPVMFLGLILLHAIAWTVVPPNAAMLVDDKATLLVITGSAFLSWTLMLSQAMESVTRGFYARADLDLILSSPTSPAMIFALRMASIAFATILMASLLAGPFIDVLAYRAGVGFLAAYGVLFGMGAAATACAIGLTVILFRTLGPKRTRLMAQIVAAVVGAGFVIGVQAVAIISYGNFSRLAVFRSAEWVAAAPDPSHWVWVPAHAAAGNVTMLATVVAIGILVLALAITMTAGSFGAHALAAASVAFATRKTRTKTGFRQRSVGATMRWKEWVLLQRDPWLVSQTLMQVLYLLPPALLLWRNFGSDVGTLVVLAPVIVMAAGQLAGGLAWLAISGEDAPDLVATAPLTPGALIRAKIEAVMMAVLLPVGPLAGAIALVSPRIAIVTLVAVILASGSATIIQILFRRQARRSHFRRRQTSSRVATFAEAFVSLSWAAAAGIAAAGSAFAIIPAIGAIGILLLVRAIAGRIL